MGVHVATVDDLEAVVERAIARHVSVRRLAWTVPEVATSLGTSPDSVRRLIRNGHLPLVPGMGQRQLIPVQALEAFVLAGAVGAAGDTLPSSAASSGPSGSVTDLLSGRPVSSPSSARPPRAGSRGPDPTAGGDVAPPAA